MSAITAVRLLEIEPDLGRFLTDEELVEAQRLAVPVRTIPRSSLDVAAILEEAHAFGALIVEGMVLQRVRVGGHTAMRLLGGGDIISRGGTRPMLLSEPETRAAARTQLAMLGNEVLLAAHRWPRIIAGLQVRMAEQADRLAAQLVICQLPRVEDRLLALLWLLAESWGQVTAAGTVLPLSLTHDALGELIGARRPTVTLALGELSERGAIVRQDAGWLLLESIEEPGGESPKIEEPTLIEPAPSLWTGEPERSRPGHDESFAFLAQTIGALRERHEHNVAQYRERIERIRRTRERALARARRRRTS